ncbi:hypothetical protein [Novosphingobium sp. AP12]|uniref:hypothetical protein n=1 Tax=Novosphingobium sp. AP12 TaxID=1144305 RepID=UPI000271DDF8|nr:hypothetical protein [Novosphingobium sp. AP12]EJL21890.1 hypothetical protein PMI02_04875 [Novosphingobium sp. AP12]
MSGNGIPAGRLSIEIVAEIARLQADMDKCKRLVSAASGDIARSAKFANDNLAGIGKGASANVIAFSRDVARLKASVDPAWASLQKYKQQVALLRQSLAEGAITHKQFVEQLRGAVSTYQNVGKAVATSSGASRQFAMQMSQVGQQVMAGTSAVQAFAMQLPDIAVGMSVAGTSTNAFIKFFSSSWGIGITTALALLAPLVAKLFETNDTLAEGVEKLRNDAIETVAVAKAKDAFGRTLEGVTAAIRDQNEELVKSQTTSRQAEIDAYNLAKSHAETALQIRSETAALLEQQKVLAENAKSQHIFAGGPGGAQSLVANQYAAEVERVQKRLDEANAAIAKALETQRRAEIPLDQRAVKESIDAAAAATGKYERNLQSLNDQRARGLISQKRYIELETAAQVSRDKAIKAAEDAKKKPAGPTAEERRAETLGRESAATDALIAGLYKLADAYGVSDAAALKAEVTARAQEQGIRRQADVADYVAQQLRKATAEQIVAGAQAAADLNQQARAQNFVNAAVKAGKLDVENAATALADMAQQRGLLTAMNVAGANGDVQGYEAAKKALQALTAAQIADNKARREAADHLLTAQINRSIDDTRRETQLTKDLGAARLDALRGLSGDALEDELARIAAAHAKIAIQMRAEADAARELEIGHTEAAAAIRRKAEADKTQVDVAYDIEKQTVALDRYNDRLRQTISILGQLGKVGEGLGAILGILTGNTGSVGGKLGDLLNVGMTGTDQDGKKIASTIGAEVSKVFKKDGAFAKAMVPLLQGAGTGMAASSALFGKQSTSEQAGSAIGGALGGSKVVEKALSKGLEGIAKGLGDFAGPLGSIAGGIIGNVLGGLMTKVKWGRVDLSAAGVSGTSGNSGSSEKAALAAGNSIFSSLTDLASQFGGLIGDFGNISVGVRHGDYRVNASGTSLKVKKGAVDFNDDAEAAIAYAMKLAIERGAITGIRQSTNNLLKAGDDLSAQLTKAMSFEGVFTDLKGYLDPVGAELDTIDKEFANLRAIFKEAGASAEEYAQLEQLLSIRRQEAMDKEKDALDDIRSRIAEAQGDDATVTAIARAKELKDATSDAQRAELQRLYAIEDANAAQEKLTEAQDAATTAAEQLRQAWSSIGDDLMDEVNRIRGLTGGSDAASFAALQGQFNAAVTAARGGDQAAAGRLVDLSQSLLEVAGNTATSRQELERIKAQTAATLEGVYNAIQAMDASATSPSTAAETSAATSTSTPSAEATATSDLAAEVRGLRAEVVQLRTDINTGNAAIAGNTGKIAKRFDDVTAAAGGNAISVTGTK